MGDGKSLFHKGGFVGRRRFSMQGPRRARAAAVRRGGRGPHRRAHAVAPAGLRRIQRLVRGTDQFLGLRRAGQGLECIHARAQRHEPVFGAGMDDLEFAYRAADALRQHDRTRHVGVRQQHRQLFPAVARRQVSRAPARDPGDGAADGLQAFVAGRVAVDVVVLLEAVHIHHDQRERAGIAHRAAELVVQRHVELPAVREPGQAVFHGQRVERLVQRLQRVARVPQLVLRLDLEFELLDQPPSDESDDQREHHDAGRMPERFLPPAGQRLVLRQGRADEQRVVLESAETVQPHGAVLRRLDERGAGSPLRGIGAKQPRIAHVPPDHLGHERPARHHRSVVEHQRHRPGFADVQAVVELHEKVDVDGRERHAGKAAVRMVDAPRHRHQQLAAGAALHRNADVRAAVFVRAMEDEVLAARVVQVLRRRAAGVRDPVAVLVVDVQAVELRKLIDLRGKHLAKPLDRRRPGAVVLDPFDDADQRRIRRLERVVGLLRHRARKVRGRHVHLPQLDRARLPAVPAVDRQQAKADDGHEGHRPEGDGGSAKHVGVPGSGQGSVAL